MMAKKKTLKGQAVIYFAVLPEQASKSIGLNMSHTIIDQHYSKKLLIELSYLIHKYCVNTHVKSIQKCAKVSKGCM